MPNTDDPNNVSGRYVARPLWRLFVCREWELDLDGLAKDGVVQDQLPFVQPCGSSFDVWAYEAVIALCHFCGIRSPEQRRGAVARHSVGWKIASLTMSAVSSVNEGAAAFFEKSEKRR
jgi:hypothetical protein